MSDADLTLPPDADLYPSARSSVNDGLDSDCLKPSVDVHQEGAIDVPNDQRATPLEVSSTLSLRGNEIRLRDPRGVVVIEQTGSSDREQDALRQEGLRLRGLEQFMGGRPSRLGGRIEVHAGKVISMDVQGDFDVTGDEPNFQENEEGLLVATLRLAYSNRFEIACQARKRRKRLLESCSSALADTLAIELKSLRTSASVSSVSEVSQKNGERSVGSSIGHCDPGCWLKMPIKPTQSIANDIIYTLKLPVDPWFRYKPIRPDPTRILQLHARTSTQPIILSMVPMTHRDAGNYEALSYTWGLVSLEKRVVLLNDRILSVPKSLYTILLYLSDPNRSRWLWIDAICINQEDNLEKAFQIPMMATIYRNAVNVVVWMGEHADNSELAVAGMKFLDVKENRQRVFHYDHDPECIARLHELYNSLLSFYDRPWFRRTWVRQEIMAAKKAHIQCGVDIVPWYAMKRTANRLRLLHNTIKNQAGLQPQPLNMHHFVNLEYLARGWRYGTSAFNFMAETGSVYYDHGGGFLELLMISRAFDATDDRDKVYGVLGLARVPTSKTDLETLEPSPTFTVDYSHTLSEVYEHVAKYFINRDRNLDVLCLLNTHRGPGSSDLPSWIPDWRVPTSYAGISDCWDYIGMKHSAANAAHAELQLQDGSGKLAITIVPLDEIAKVLDITGEVSNLFNIEVFGRQNPDAHVAETRPFVPGLDLRRFVRVPSVDAFFLAPAEAQVGDLVVLALGCRLPLLLRSASGDDNSEEESVVVDTDAIQDSDITPHESGEGSARDAASDGIIDQPDKLSEEAAGSDAEETEEDAASQTYTDFEGLHFMLVGPCFSPRMMNGKAFESLKDLHRWPTVTLV